jgi:hypothetical protein
MKRAFSIIVAALLVGGCAASTKPEPEEVTFPPHVPKTPQELEAHFSKMFAGMRQEIDKTKARLLHKTDHQAVLLASREVIRTRLNFKRDPKWHGDEDPRVSLIAAADSTLPKAVRQLDAASIFAYDDHVLIEFGGGWHHQGLIAYSESFTNVPMANDGFQKIIDGLWFYEDTQ